MKNITSSAVRTSAIGKYLVALSLSFAKIADRDDQKLAKATAPSGRRRQIHVLYLLSDLLHHTKYHTESPSASSVLTHNLQSYIVDLFRAASAYNLDVYVRQHKCIADLLDIWEGKGYFPSSYVRKLRETASTASKFGYANGDEDTKLSEETLSEEKKDAPYILPSSHGDPFTPYYDLPAGNMMPHIIPNSARSINSQSMKALQLTGGPANENLVVAVKEFLRNVESIDTHSLEGREDDMDIDELGQLIIGDETAADILEGEGYYGWSRAFCNKMKNRGIGLGKAGSFMGRASSIDRNVSPRKRRRHSDFGSSRSRDSTRDHSRSRSSSDQSSKRRNGQRSSSRPRKSLAEQRQRRSLRSRSRSLSYSPPQMAPTSQPPPTPASTQPMQQIQAQGRSPPPSIPFPHSFSKGFTLGPGGVPIPPPPPPNYHGPWPPPPPPIQNSRNGIITAPPAPPTGPKVGQNYGAPAFESISHASFQGPTPAEIGGWAQQQFGHVSRYPYGDRGSAQQPFDGNVQNSRGRGYRRGS